MARKQGSGAETVRKLTKTGEYTYYVTIPKAHIEQLGWKERQKLVVRRSGSKLIIEDWKPGK
jgi:bifunctional DNA-binding transcriptional regulator/antitoxin component of YhaV-PrlF toxin-antitoxin module